MEESAITVIIPLWNRGKHMKELLENIQNIIDSNIEKKVSVMIGDFNSTDIDLEKIKLSCTFPIDILIFDGDFCIGKALQLCFEKIKNNEGIVYFCDADAHFPKEIFERIRKNTIRGKQYYCPIVSFEKPNKEIWTPIVDHKGTGHIGIYISDFKLSKGWTNSKYMTTTQWGGHDSYMYAILTRNLRLKAFRHIENDQWVKIHERPKGKWYTKTRVKNPWDH
jgi:glycosyltransferase involved in cell wall biosynthesis